MSTETTTASASDPVGENEVVGGNDLPMTFKVRIPFAFQLFNRYRTNEMRRVRFERGSCNDCIKNKNQN